MVRENELLQEIVYRAPMMVRSFKSHDWGAFRQSLEKIKEKAGPDDPFEPVWDLLFGDGSGGVISDEDVGDLIWEAHRVFLQVRGEWESFLAEDADPLLPEANHDGQMALPFSSCEPQEPEESIGPPETTRTT